MSTRQSQAGVLDRSPRSVRLIENEWIELPDGVRLAARIWLPDDAEARPVSAILDWVPYRKSDGTAIGDGAWGTYFAAHGFAFVRIDLRGSGDSTGLLSDEYSELEQLDAEHAIEWIADREWCTGSVGMIGVSWGGFAALQLAARAPEALRGVVAIHGSDDRYADDVHYIGGCVSAMDMPQWANSMLAYLNQPPDPAVVGDGWREEWRRRLDGASLFIDPWLRHQRRDAYWRQGSACERYDTIGCPVFAVGGWSDGYRDMVLRVVEHVSAPVRGLIGPWGHTSPEHGAPGPAIGFLQECVRFFDASLDGVANGFFEQPRLISYLQEPVVPAGSYDVRPGRWVADPAWPSPAVAERLFALGADGLHADETSVSAGSRSIRGLQTTGIDGGVWCGDGSPADFALDQRPDDGASLCWDTPPLRERVELLGKCEARLRVSVDHPQAVIVARVCDIAPDGRSTLVARGVLNLSRRDGHDRTVPMPVGQSVEVRVAMQSTGYAIPVGHQIRLAVTNAYWPLVWPSPEVGVLTVHGGVLSVPVRGLSALDAEPFEPFQAPETGEALASETTMQRDGGRTVSRDLATGETTVTFDWRPSRVRLTDTGTEIGEENVSTYRIVEGDPLTAIVVCRATVTLSRPGFEIRVAASTTMSCDRERFLVTTTLDAFEDGVRVHARAQTDRFDRDGT